jgi:hypothetical protein
MSGNLSVCPQIFVIVQWRLIENPFWAIIDTDQAAGRMEMSERREKASKKIRRSKPMSLSLPVMTSPRINLAPS